jgi:hypothetical protein
LNWTLTVLRPVFNRDIRLFPFAPGGDHREGDFQTGNGDRYVSGFLLLDHYRYEPHVCAGLGAAEFLTARL